MARKRKGKPIHGWVILDKPLGRSSAWAVARVRHITGAAKAGHGGTLDPLATGVLPVALGEATKTVSYIQDGVKVYAFAVRWGQATQTDDGEGGVVAQSAVRPGAAEIEAALGDFTGDIDQTPPAYSAIKVDGKRAYALSRDGNAPVITPRRVRIDRFEWLASPTPDTAEFLVECGKGTYIRALARDLAVKLGTLGHVAAMRRLAVGAMTEKAAISLERLEEVVHSAAPDGYLHPVELALADIPALDLTGPQAQRLRAGQMVRVPTADPGAVCAMASGHPLLSPMSRTVRSGPCGFSIFDLTRSSNFFEEQMSITAERKQELIATYAIAKGDTGSADVQVAILSERIRNLTDHFKEHAKDRHSRRGLLKMISTRRKLLDYLKRQDFKRYEALIKALGLRK